MSNQDKKNKDAETSSDGGEVNEDEIFEDNGEEADDSEEDGTDEDDGIEDNGSVDDEDDETEAPSDEEQVQHAAKALGQIVLMMQEKGLTRRKTVLALLNVVTPGLYYLEKSRGWDPVEFATKFIVDWKAETDKKEAEEKAGQSLEDMTPLGSA